MRLLRTLTAARAAALVFVLAGSSAAEAQFLDRLIQRAQSAAEDEVGRKVESVVRGSIRCAVGDLECVNKAKARGRPVVMTDSKGKILIDDNGQPISDPEEAARRTGASGGAASAGAGAAGTAVRPGEGAWANYDFVPGDRVLFTDDFNSDRVGNFPRRFDLLEGNWEIVEWQGGRYLRATSNGTIGLTLPETLPDRFSIEFTASVGHPNSWLEVTTAPHRVGTRDYAGSMPVVSQTRAGLSPVEALGPNTIVDLSADTNRNAPVTVRIMADGAYMKMFVNQQRVVNAPNAVFPRTNKLFFSAYWVYQATPVLMGPISIAAGGLELYDTIERDGRVAIQGIYFDVNSAVIRPESTGTLNEIGHMLREHAGLRLTIEGHTDSDGDDASNLDLSARRAAAVKTQLVSAYGIDGSRLETAGLGETRPVADNATPEGKQQNRRVELVRQGS